MHAEHQDVGDALVPLALKVVFSQPKGLVTVAIHELSDSLGLVEYGCYMFIGEPTLIDRGTIESYIFQINMSRE
jgi:hypothetical protein